MKKFIRCKKRAKLLGWNRCEKVVPMVHGMRSSSLVHKNNVLLPFLPFSKLFFGQNQTCSGHDYLDERGWFQA